MNGKEFTKKDVNEAIDLYAKKCREEFGHLVWSNKHVIVFLLAGILLGAILTHCVI